MNIEIKKLTPERGCYTMAIKGKTDSGSTGKQKSRRQGTGGGGHA